jgi:hypothetical protein
MQRKKFDGGAESSRSLKKSGDGRAKMNSKRHEHRTAGATPRGISARQRLGEVRRCGGGSSLGVRAPATNCNGKGEGRRKLSVREGLRKCEGKKRKKQLPHL